MTANKDKLVQQAIENAIPVDSEQVSHIGNEPIFVFSQYLKGVVPEGTPSEELEDYFQQWYDLSSDKLIDEDFDCIEYDDAWLFFMDVWDNKKVRFAKGNALNIAWARALHRTEDRPEMHWCRNKRLQDLAHVCYELQQLSQTDDFFISGDKAGKVMERCEKKGRAGLHVLISKGIIIKTKQGGGNRANHYKCIGEAVPTGKTKMQGKIDELRESEGKE